MVLDIHVCKRSCRAHSCTEVVSVLIPYGKLNDCPVAPGNAALAVEWRKGGRAVGG